MAKFLVKVACMAVLCMIVVAPSAEAAISCGTVIGTLRPCINYVMGKGPLPAVCCSSIRSLNAAARTTGDRQQACTCLKGAAKSIKGVNFSLAGGLPGKCGVNIGYPISTSVDCSKVH